MNRWLTTILALAVCSVSAAGYHLLKKIPVAGDYGWDYAATDTAEAAACYRRTRPGSYRDRYSIRTAVVGKRSEAAPTCTARPIAREFSRGFISESNPGSVVIFDLKTLAKIAEVPVGKDPNLIMVDHKTGRVFTADRGDKQVTAIDAEEREGRRDRGSVRRTNRTRRVR